MEWEFVRFWAQFTNYTFDNFLYIYLLYTLTHIHMKYSWTHFWNQIFGNWCLVNIVYRVGTPLRWQSLMIMCVRWITQYTCVCVCVNLSGWVNENDGEALLCVTIPRWFFPHQYITNTQAHATTITNIVQLKSKSHGVHVFKLSIFIHDQNRLLFIYQ